MDVAYRLRQMREWKKLSQGDIEERTGLLRCYISRLENGHIVPSIETLEKISRALEVPMYQLFLDGHESTAEIEISSDDAKDWASAGIGRRALYILRVALAHMSEEDRTLLLFIAGKMVSAKPRGK